MKPQHIYIIRHGQSASNANPNVHATVPDWKVPLTDKGWTQAREAGAALRAKIENRPIRWYVSPYRRTRETLQGIHEAFDPAQRQHVREDPRLREQEWGHLRTAEQSDIIDAARQAYGTLFYRIPDGESGLDVYDRCTGFLDTLYRDFEKPDYPADVGIVTHGFTLRALLMRWLHFSVEDFHTLSNPRNAEMVELSLDPTNHYQLTAPLGRYQDAQPTRVERAKADQ